MAQALMVLSVLLFVEVCYGRRIRGSAERLVPDLEVLAGTVWIFSDMRCIVG
jgi:hypothetical protein